jgi:phosphoribosyl-ATP pyrophosphohydrolase
LAGEVAVIDLDAARGAGSNRRVVEGLLGLARCRVGGGIRTIEDAVRWLDAGAAKVILGTAARPELLAELPAARAVAALDCRDGEVVDQGWTRATGERVEARMESLRGLVGGFLVTFVEREGRMEGADLGRVAELAALAAPARLTVAGGVRSVEEIAEIDRLGADCQVGMALYTGALSLAACVAAPLKSDRPDGLWPTVVCDESGAALGLAYSNLESLEAALEERRGVYWSRKSGVWRKGETSGDWQELLAVDVDCDRDALRFIVRQHGRGFCHTGTATCWGPARGLAGLADTVSARMADPPPGSYTARLLGDPALLGSKLREEAAELAAAEGREEAAQEAADVLYFLSVKLASHGARWADVLRVLDRRALRATRRPGEAKEGS